LQSVLCSYTHCTLSVDIKNPNRNHSICQPRIPQQIGSRLSDDSLQIYDHSKFSRKRGRSSVGPQYCYGAVLPRRRPHHVSIQSVRPSVCLSVRPSVRPVPPSRRKTKRPRKTKLGRKDPWDTGTRGPISRFPAVAWVGRPYPKASVPPPRGKTKRPTYTKLGRKGPWDTSTPGPITRSRGQRSRSRRLIALFAKNPHNFAACCPINLIFGRWRKDSLPPCPGCPRCHGNGRSFRLSVHSCKDGPITGGPSTAAPSCLASNAIAICRFPYWFLGKT